MVDVGVHKVSGGLQRDDHHQRVHHPAAKFRRESTCCIMQHGEEQHTPWLTKDGDRLVINTAASRQGGTTNGLSVNGVSQLTDFSRQVGWRSQLMASRPADFSQASEASQKSSPGPPEKKHASALNNPSYKYRDLSLKEKPLP